MSDKVIQLTNHTKKAGGVGMTIPIDQIIIPVAYKHTSPSESKMLQAKQYYEKYGVISNEVILSENDVLLDGYISYLLAIEKGITEIPIKRRHLEIIKAIHPGRTKEYVWKVPFEIQGKIKIGDTVNVPTCYGIQRVQVVGVEKMATVTADINYKEAYKTRTLFRVRENGTVEVINEEECAKRGVIDGERL